MNDIKVLVLDFDNTLILNQETGSGSEELKDQAWYKVFPECEPDKLRSIIDLVKGEYVSGRGDRNDFVIKMLHHLKFKDSEIEKESARRLNSFDKIMQDGIIKIGVSEKVKDFLASFATRASIYLNTATPVENVSKSLDLLGIKKFFKKIYGRPGTKLDNIKAILASESINPSEVLFVDDQEDSYQISKQVGCKFVGIHTARNKLWHKGLQTFPIIESIDELSKFV